MIFYKTKNLHVPDGRTAHVLNRYDVPHLAGERGEKGLGWTLVVSPPRRGMSLARVPTTKWVTTVAHVAFQGVYAFGSAGRWEPGGQRTHVTKWDDVDLASPPEMPPQELTLHDYLVFQEMWEQFLASWKAGET